MEKTNVMRLLDAAKIPYGSYEYAAPDLHICLTKQLL